MLNTSRPAAAADLSIDFESPFLGAFFMDKKTFYSDISLAPAWCMGGAFLLSLGWLMPNQARPWTAFHSDAWIACILLVVSLVVFSRSRQATVVHMLPVAAVLASLLPWIQYQVGKLSFSGQAWISSAYVLGFALALLTGQQWQRLNAKWMERFFFLAVLIAGVVSVSIQLIQWFRLTESLDLLNIWILYFPIDQVRPYANMAQPNQLATLLLWALLGCAWATYRGYLKIVGGVSVAAFLLVGLALTQSRSAMIGLLVALCACWTWRSFFMTRSLTCCVAGLAFWYVFLLLALPVLGSLLLLETSSNIVDRSVNESRLAIWRMVLDAAFQNPWTGYGWNQVLPAQLAVAESHSELAGKYIAQSHNLFLDFIVWVGFPTGLLLAFLILAWTWTAWRRVRNESEAIYLLVIVVVGIHAMVELPLHYAYFLLPAGLVMGSLNASMNIWLVGKVSRSIVLGFWMLLALLFGVIVNEYFRLESAYNDIRFEKANFVHAPKPHIPETLVLDHLQYWTELYAMTPVADMPSDLVEKYVIATTYMPSPYNVSKLVVILALNQRPAAARFWIRKASVMMSADNFASAQKDWERASKQFPQIASTLQVHP